MSDFMGPVLGPLRSNTCEYGVFSQRCGRRATTTRQRPGGEQSWHACAFHAEVLDRIRESISEHGALLALLADEECAS